MKGVKELTLPVGNETGPGRYGGSSALPEHSQRPPYLPFPF
jgi:hypothetical protein